MTEETLMSRNQRKLLFAVATSTLVIGLQSFAVAELKCFPNCGAQQQQTERWKIMQDQQPKTQKTVVTWP
jgi:flagellar biogenesis protein FliO